MILSRHQPLPRDARPSTRKMSRDTVFLVGDLLPLCDFAGVLLAAWLGALAYAGWLAPGAAHAGLWLEAGPAALAAAVLAPLILCDRAFVSFASGRQTASLARCFAVRFAMFAGVVAAIGLASRALESLPALWLALWLAGSLALTAIVRVLLVRTLRRLEHEGQLAEAVAVVGAGPVADRLIRLLQQTRGESLEILGVFDDAASGAPCAFPATGTIDDLVELGKAGSMDWILVTLPASDTVQLQALVHRLKSLAVQIGLCPQDIGLAPPRGAARGAGLPVLLLARPASRWETAVAAVETVLPRWIVTLLGLPLALVGLIAASLRERAASAVH